MDYESFWRRFIYFTSFCMNKEKVEVSSLALNLLAEHMPDGYLSQDCCIIGIPSDH